ncbi:MAG: hypothetical protein ACYC5X_17925 [Syntrophales bacterium]
MLRRSDPTVLPTQQWQFSITIALTLNILAGFVTAFILSVADTPSKILIGSTVVIFLCLTGWCIFLFWRSKLLSGELQHVKNSLNLCQNRFSEQLKSVGISEFAEKLGESRWSPTSVMARAHHEVRFLGVFGHKWVMDSSKKDAFRSMLTSVQLNGGRVYFLLLNPSSDSAKRLANFRKLDLNTYEGFPSIDIYKSFAAEFDCFQLRLFDHFPFIRLIFVDGLCAVSRFKLNDEAKETLNAPQLAFAPEQPGGPWTLYQALVLLFDHLWSQAIDPFVESSSAESPVRSQDSITQ